MKVKLALFLTLSFSSAVNFGCDNEPDGSRSAQDMTVKVAPADPGNAPQPVSPPPPTTGAAAAVAREPVPAAPDAKGERQSAGGVSWELPAGWSKAADAPMRLATIGDGQAEIAISSFPGDVGGTMANVVRWQNQVGAPPAASEAEAEKLMAEVDVAGVKIRTLDLSGRQRMLVAIVPAHGKLFFFKMMGSADLIAARKDVFTNFVKTIRVE
jgi:hypothetical protein